MTKLERIVNQINEEYFLPLLTEEMWKEDFETKEYYQAKSFLQPYLKYFNKADHSLVIQVLKSQLKYLEWADAVHKNLGEEEYEEQSAQHRHFQKMVPRFIRIMRSFQFAGSSEGLKQELTFERQTKLFEITRVTFEGKRKNNQIILEGDILNVISAFFDVLGRIETEDQLRNLQIFSEDLYYSFWQIWFFYIKKLSKVKHTPNPRNKVQLKNFIRNTKAYQLHRFLKDYSKLMKANEISEKEKKFIGDFFLLANLVQDDDPKQPFYIDTTHYNDVRNWIVRGEYL